MHAYILDCWLVSGKVTLLLTFLYVCACVCACMHVPTSPYVCINISVYACTYNYAHVIVSAQVVPWGFPVCHVTATHVMMPHAPPTRLLCAHPTTVGRVWQSGLWATR